MDFKLECYPRANHKEIKNVTVNAAEILFVFPQALS